MSLSVREVSMNFGGLLALNDVSLEVPRGAVVGLIGPNGAGKSTLVGCLTGALTATRGSATWDGAQLVGSTPEAVVRAGVSRTFQHARLFPDETVLDNVRIGGHTAGRSGFLGAALRSRSTRRDERELTRIAYDALAAVGSEDLADQRASELTAGQQRLVAVARAIAGFPSLLLLDEPAAGLNDVETQQLEGNLRRLSAERDLTMVVIEHHLQFVMSISDEVVVLAQGQVIAHGTPSDVSRDAGVIAAYTGS